MQRALFILQILRRVQQRFRNTKGRKQSMFGNKKKYNVSLSEKQIKELTKNMSSKQNKEFAKRCKEAQSDREWDMLMMMEVFMDDDF